MSKSNLENSQADTLASLSSDCSLDSLEAPDPQPHAHPASPTLALLFSLVMAAISGVLVRRHSRKWKRVALAVGVSFYLLVKSSGPGRRQQ